MVVIPTWRKHPNAGPAPVGGSDGQTNWRFSATPHLDQSNKIMEGWKGPGN